MSNPILDFGIDPKALQYVGECLQRPECILAEKDGTTYLCGCKATKSAPLCDGSHKAGGFVSRERA